MALLVINSDDFSDRLRGFALSCKACGSSRVTLDINWAAYPSCSWATVTVICDACKQDETIYDASTLDRIYVNGAVSGASGNTSVKSEYSMPTAKSIRRSGRMNQEMAALNLYFLLREIFTGFSRQKAFRRLCRTFEYLVDEYTETLRKRPDSL